MSSWKQKANGGKAGVSRFVSRAQVHTTCETSILPNFLAKLSNQRHNIPLEVRFAT